MNVLMLGATGYLGTKLVYNLQEHNDNIYVLVRKSSDISKLLKSGLPKEHIWLIEEVNKRLKDTTRIDWFINCACCYARKEVQDAQIIEANYTVPLECALICMENNIQNFINIDTGLPNDFNIYSKSKAQLADMLRWYSERKNLYVRNILLENYYGKGEPIDRFLPSVIEKMKRNEDILLTDGTQKRDFIYIDDVINAIRFLMGKKQNVNYLDIPIGTGEAPCVKDVIEYLAEITHSSSKLLFGAIQKRQNEPNSVADISLMQSMGWKYQYGWKDGLKQII